MFFQNTYLSAQHFKNNDCSNNSSQNDVAARFENFRIFRIRVINL